MFLAYTVKFYFTFRITLAVKFEMNVFWVSLETPIPISWNINYFTMGQVGGSRETWPSVAGWLGEKRPFSAWRNHAMTPNWIFCRQLAILTSDKHFGATVLELQIQFIGVTVKMFCTSFDLKFFRCILFRKTVYIQTVILSINSVRIEIE